MGTTYYWHDYETFGTDPSRDRPVQFAGIRTDAELNIVGEPLMLFSAPARDVLPHPDPLRSRPRQRYGSAWARP